VRISGLDQLCGGHTPAGGLGHRSYRRRLLLLCFGEHKWAPGTGLTVVETVNSIASSRKKLPKMRHHLSKQLIYWFAALGKASSCLLDIGYELNPIGNLLRLVGQYKARQFGDLGKAFLGEVGLEVEAFLEGLRMEPMLLY